MVGVPRRSILPPTPAENWNTFWNKATSKAQGAWDGMIGGLMAPGNALRGNYDQLQVMADGSLSQVDPRMVQDASSLAGMVTLGSGAMPAQAGTLRMGMGAKAIGDIEAKAKELGVKLSVSERPDSLTLHSIVVPKDARGKGVGTSVMQELIDYADANGKTIALTPSTDLGASSKSALERFYQRLGFVSNKGRKADFRFSETYRRDPKGE